MDIIVEYDSIEEELKYSREIWEKGNYVGFRNLAGGRHNVGKFVRMLEKINKELKSVEGDISSMREGALYSVDELKYASVTVRAINLISDSAPMQLDLFVDQDSMTRQTKIDNCIESLRARFGSEIIKNAVLLKNVWMMNNQAKLTMPTGMANMR